MNCYSNQLEEMFICVKLIKIAEERQGKGCAKIFMPLNYIDIYEIYIHVLDNMNELLCYRSDGEYMNSTYKFATDEMTEYYHLAYKYGELKNISKNKNPYFINAEKYLRSTLGSIDSYCYNYRLYPSRTRQTRLYFLTDDEYWMPYETITELYCFFDYFPEKLPELKASIKQIKNRRREAA